MRRSHLPRAALLAALIAAVAPALSADAAVAAGLSWTNPLIAQDFPDPSVTRIGGEYWATGTSSAAAPRFPLMRSTDLVTWQAAGNVLARAPRWARGSLWAPEIVADAAGVRVYYAAQHRRGRMCVAVATARQPVGPYIDRGPLVCQPAGSIDPTAVLDAAGRKYLVWKEDGNAIGRPTRIWAQRLRPDGRRLIGAPWVLLRDRDRWEGGIVEAPTIIRRGAWTYLVYSGNAYGPPACNYAVGVARARSLRGPFRRSPLNPILRGNDAWRCPGHASLFADASGRVLVAYHAYRATDPPLGARYALMDPVSWTASGWPQIAAGTGPSTTMVLP